MIPRILHRVWVGPDPLPEEFARFGESWRRHHPEWEMRLWTEDRLPPGFVRREAYERLRMPAERADIIRLEVLFRFGGVYVDTDFECLRPIDALLPEDVDFFVCDIKPGRVNNALIGAVAGHPLLERALGELRPVAEFGVVDKRGTGPLFLDALVREHADVTIYPPELFYPVTDVQRERAYAIHYQAGSWKASEAWRETALKRGKLLAEARERIEELEAVVGRRRGGSGIRAWSSRVRFGERLRRVVRRTRRVIDGRQSST